MNATGDEMKRRARAEGSAETARVVSNIRYGELVNAVDPTKGAGRSGALWSAFRLYRASREADVVFTNEGKATPLGLIVLSALLSLRGGRKLVLAEFLPGSRTGLRGRLVTRAYRTLLPRVLLRAQVMTEWERDDYATRYAIPRERLRFIPFYYFDDRLEPDPISWEAVERSGYLSTGKNSCDWTTVIAAANGQNWPLTIVSRQAERERIQDAAVAAGISVKSDVPRAEHDAMLAQSEVLIVALKERSVSAGHVRLMTAATYGVPVVATAIRGIAGYEKLTAATVPPGDAAALRDAVADVLANPDRLRAKMELTRAIARDRPYSTYASEIVALVTDRD